MTILESVLGSEMARVIVKECHKEALKQVKLEKPSSFHSEKNRVTQREKQVVEEVETFVTLFQEGADILESSLKQLSLSDHEMVAKELQKITKTLPKQKGKTEASSLLSKKNLWPKPKWKLSKKSLEAFVNAATHLMEQEKFEDAVKALYVLCTIESNIYEMWIAFGHAAFYAKQFPVAHMAYFMASSLKLESPWPFIWASKACEEMNENGQACLLLEEAKALAQKSSDKKECALVSELNDKISLLKAVKK